MKCDKIISWLAQDHDVHSFYWSQMNNLALEVYNPVSIGFEEIFSRLDVASNPNGNYPPYNIKKLDDTKQILRCPCGFKKKILKYLLKKS